MKTVDGQGKIKYKFAALGLIPGQLWPLQQAFKGWSGQRAKYKKRKLLKALEKTSFDFSVNSNEMEEISGLFVAADITFPDNERVEAVLAAMKRHAEVEFGISLAELDHVLLGQSFVDPTKVLEALWSLRVPLEGVKPKLFDVDNDLLKQESEDLQDPISKYTSEQANELSKEFCEFIITERGARRRPLIFLDGPSYGGKTRTIIIFLKSFEPTPIDDSSKHYTLPSALNPVGLPIMAGNFKNLSFYSILKRVHRFHYPNSPGRPDYNIIDSQSLWQAIETAARTPAIYIFNCAKLYERDQTESFFAGRGTADLIEMLLEQNKNTRIIVAGSKIEIRRDETSTFKHVNKAYTMDAEKACIGDYATFFSEGNFNAFTVALKNQPQISLKTEIKASVVLSLTSLTKLLGHVDAQLLAAFFDYASNQSKEKNSEDYYLENYYSVWWDLIEQYFNDRYDKNINYFKAFKILVASDDAVYINSLSLMLREWNSEKGIRKDAIPSKGKLYEFINDIEVATSERLVTISDSCSLRESEKFHFDFIDAEFGNKDILIDPPIRMGLQQAFMARHPDEIKMCWRLLARMARRRARHVRLNSPFPYGGQLSDLDRDVQSCVEVLSSIEVSDDSVTFGSDYSAETQPYYSEKEAFDLKRLDNGIAVLRYVNNTIFRNEIEGQSKYRLSMVLDDDFTRLDIIGSLLHGVGRKYRGLTQDPKEKPINDNHQLSIHPEKFLGEKLPLHIRESFSVREQVQLLESIGISAFFLHKRVILEKAVKQLESLINTYSSDKPKPKWLRGSLSRLKGYLNDIDLLCQHEKRTAEAIEKDLKHESQRHEAFIDEFEADTRILDEVMFRRSLLLRCYERQLVILTRNMKQENFSKYFRDLTLGINENMELLLSNTKNKSGRFGGRLIRNLFVCYLGNPGIIERRPWEEADLSASHITEILEKYLDLMTSRLAEYSGAERASALAVYALYHIHLTHNASKNKTLEHYYVALEYAKRARDISHFNKISLAVKIQVTWIYCQVKFLHHQKAGKSTSTLKKEVNSFKEIAKGHGFSNYVKLATELQNKLDKSNG